MNKYINNPHDYDYIIFVKEPVDMCHARRILHRYLKSKKENVRGLEDFIQVRNELNEETEYGSWINKLMIKLIGKDIEFKFDIIGDDREKYKQILINTIDDFNAGRIRNEKRYYQIYQGMCIMNNNSYELTKEQIKNVNILHDMNAGDNDKRQQLIEDIKKEVESWRV